MKVDQVRNNAIGIITFHFTVSNSIHTSVISCKIRDKIFSDLSALVVLTQKITIKLTITIDKSTNFF
jgi:hypothetical protein